MFYKCYYHPKIDGLHSCQGCRLPICDDCRNDLNYCPECVERQAAVAHLRLVRQAQMISGHHHVSRSGRLRLALRQVGGGRTQQLQMATAILHGVVDEALPRAAAARTAALGKSGIHDVMAKPKQRVKAMPDVHAAVTVIPRRLGTLMAFCASIAVLLGLLSAGRWVYHDGLEAHKPLYVRQRPVQ